MKYKNPTHQRNQRMLMGPGNLVVFAIKAPAIFLRENNRCRIYLVRFIVFFTGKYINNDIVIKKYPDFASTLTPPSHP